MSQLSRVARTLRRGTNVPGLTPAQIAARAGVPRSAVAKRVSDLRREGRIIYTNTRNRGGETKTFYRLAA